MFDHGRMIEANCRRWRWYWIVEIDEYLPDTDETIKLGVTQARIGHHEVRVMVRDYINQMYDTDVDDQEIHVYGADLLPDIYRKRWQYWWPWNVTRPWFPRIERGGDEWCNPSLVINLPFFLGVIVIFYVPGPMRTSADGRCKRCEIDELNGWRIEN